MDEHNPLKMKVTELKTELGKRGLSQTGLKFDLAQRLQAAMDVDEFGALSLLADPSPSLPCLAPACSIEVQIAPAHTVDGTASLIPAVTEDSVNHGDLLRQCSPTAWSYLSLSENTPASVPQDNGAAVSPCHYPDSNGGLGAAGDGGANKRKSRAQSTISKGPSSEVGTTQKGDLAPGISEENNPLEEAGASREIEKDGRAHAVKQTHGDDAKQAWDGSGLEGCLGPKSDACNKSSANVVDKKAREVDNGCNTVSERNAIGANKRPKDKTECQNKKEEPFETLDLPNASNASNPRSRDRSTQALGEKKEGNAIHKLHQPAIEQDGIPHEKSGKTLVNVEKRQTSETAKKSSGNANEDGAIQSADRAAPNPFPKESPLFLNEIGRMKSREERFGQGRTPERLGCGECSGGGCDNDGGGGGKRGGNGSQKEKRINSERASSRAVVNVSMEDVWRAKLIKRKKRFGTCPSHDLGKRAADKATRKTASEATNTVTSKTTNKPQAATNAAAKMARRAERFGAAVSGSSVPSAKTCTATRDPPGTFFTTAKSLDRAAAREPSEVAAGGYRFDPLPRRPKRTQAIGRTASSKNGKRPAKQMEKYEAGNGGGEGGGSVTLVRTMAKPVFRSVTPGDESTRAQQTAKVEKSRQRKIRFSSAVSTSDGVKPVKERHVRPPPQRIAPVSSSTPSRPTSSSKEMSSVCDRVRVTSGASVSWGYVTAAYSKRIRETEKNAAEQAARMRKRQKRFSEGFWPRKPNSEDRVNERLQRARYAD